VAFLARRATAFEVLLSRRGEVGAMAAADRPSDVPGDGRLQMRPLFRHERRG
jgi:hypothetical protein